MDYEKSIPFSGNTEKAFDIALSILMPNSFAVIRKDDKSIELAGPGGFMNTNQNPLIGVSQITISGYANELSIKADFGGVRSLMKYLIVFIISMTLFFLVLFGIMFSKKIDTRLLFLIILAPTAPWIVLIPIMGKFIKSKTAKALDSILNNMAALGKS
ncbi:MAG: hypothetical protein K8R02_01085 [Anaerohalosphaeraceae bacterium]|nr:hypothetical protein [Anaerohalosphaeraceae bacterium]